MVKTSKNMKKWKVIWLLLTNKSFLSRLTWVVEYAIRVSKNTRGDGMSDVILFERFEDKVFHEERLQELKEEQRIFVSPNFKK